MKLEDFTIAAHYSPSSQMCHISVTRHTEKMLSQWQRVMGKQPENYTEHFAVVPFKYKDRVYWAISDTPKFLFNRFSPVGNGNDGVYNAPAYQLLPSAITIPSSPRVHTFMHLPVRNTHSYDNGFVNILPHVLWPNLKVNNLPEKVMTACKNLILTYIEGEEHGLLDDFYIWEEGADLPTAGKYHFVKDDL